MMKVVTIVTACLGCVGLLVVPAMAEDTNAVKGACQTYAQLTTEPVPSASPRTGAPGGATSSYGSTPAQEGGVQAPGTRRTEQDVQAPGTHSAEFQRAFESCMSKLGR